MKNFFVALIGGIAVTGGSAAQQPGTQAVDIGGMETGQEPPGFITWRTGEGGAAEWRVVDDPTATDKKAIAQTSKELTDYRFPLAVYKPAAARNVDSWSASSRLRARSIRPAGSRSG